MATNIDKALYAAPQGLAATPEDAGIEIEIEIEGEDAEEADEPEEGKFDANLAEEMEASDLSTLATELYDEIKQDEEARKDWEETYEKGLALLGLKYEERTEPWNGACGVFHPMITEAVVRFQSETITETFPAAGPVKTKIVGAETAKKKDAAKRVQDDMNHELTDVMVEFRPEHERLLWSLPAAGSGFKKVYFDPSLDRQTSMFVPAEDILLPYGTTGAQTSYRVTHVMRKTHNEIKKLQKAGFYVDVEVKEYISTPSNIQKAKDKETGVSDLNDKRPTLYESCVDLDLKGYEDKDEDGEPTGIALPYVVTLVKGTDQIMAIRRNWREDDPTKQRRQHFVQYDYIPGFGPYGYGLFHLIGGYAKSATSVLRQLVDAGTLSNLPGGLKTRGLRIKGDDTPIAPGEFRDVDIGSGALRDNILPLPYKEPSAVLAGLLDKIVEEGRRFAATADMQVSDMSANAPVGSTLAMLERQLVVMTAVQARTHNSLKQELRLLAGIIRDNTPDEYTYDPETGGRHAKKEDYDTTEVLPVSDPNASTMSQRVVQHQAAIQMAQMAPDIYDLPQLHREMLEVLGFKNAAKIIPLPDDMRPVDPVQENMRILRCEPVKAFVFQDHESHIKVHMAATQDPVLMQLVGQNPKAPQMQAAMMAHIAEHAAFGYRQKIEQQLGMALPPEQVDGQEEAPLPPEVQNAMANMMAMAAQQVLQQNQTKAAQEAAQKAAQDPVIQMQQQQLQIDQQEVQIKDMLAQIKKQQADTDAMVKQGRLQLDTQKALADAAADADRIELEREKLGVSQQTDGMKAGVDIAKALQQAHTAANKPQPKPAKPAK